MTRLFTVTVITVLYRLKSGENRTSVVLVTNCIILLLQVEIARIKNPWSSFTVLVLYR